MARRRLRNGDGTTLARPDGAANNFRSVDATFVLNPMATEIAGMLEDGFNSEFVQYIKNTSGSNFTAGQLLVGSTTLTAAGSAMAQNIAAGSSVVVVLASVTGTIESGSLCRFTDSVSPNDVQYSICTNVSSTNYTFDEIPYDMTMPAIVVVPAICPTLATNASGGHASWVVTGTIANNGYAFVYGAARVTGLDTSGYSAVGSNVYLGTGGASTGTAPTSTTTTAQLVGKVEVKNASTGVIRYYPYRRENTAIASTGIQSGAFASGTLTSAHLLVGNGSNVATDVAVSGDVTLANTGAFTIANSAVTNAKIANSTIDLTAKVTGILPQANGGTGTSAASATGFVAAQTAAASAIATLTVGASDRSYRVSGYIKIVTSSSFNFSIKVTYTDENGASQVIALPLFGGSTLTDVLVNATARVYMGVEVLIRAQATTTITIATAGSSFSSVTYNAGASIFPE